VICWIQSAIKRLYAGTGPCRLHPECRFEEWRGREREREREHLGADGTITKKQPNMFKRDQKVKKCRRDRRSGSNAKFLTVRLLCRQKRLPLTAVSKLEGKFNDDVQVAITHRQHPIAVRSTQRKLVSSQRTPQQTQLDSQQNQKNSLFRTRQR
jgi:hypothetical protein